MSIVDQVDYSHALATVRAEMLRRRGKENVPPPKTCSIAKWPPNYEQVLLWRGTQLARFELEPHLLAASKGFYRTHPVEFINHWCDSYDPRNVSTGRLVRFPFIMFPRQEELVNFLWACLQGDAPGLVEKSRDMGATWVCIAFSVWLWLFYPGVAVGWGSRKQEQVDRIGDASSIFEKTRMLIRWIPGVFTPSLINDGEQLKQYACINSDTGSTITGEIGDNIGRGGRTRIYFVDEAGHLEHPEMVEAALSDNTRVRIDVSSVSGLGTVFHRTREAGVDWVPGAKVVRTATNVFVMDWRDHPMKSAEWHKERKSFFINKGLPHVFAREVDRDYAASVEGVIINADWVEAAIDAHLVLGFADEGQWVAGLDVADAGLDSNALAKRKGPILKYIEEWGERDTGATTRRAIAACSGSLPCELQYDSVGVGSGVKAETNRLRSENLLPKGLILVPWSAGAAVLNPHGFTIINDNGMPDRESPINKDFYQNLKAQAWWMLARRFERTYRAITEPDYTWKAEDLISLPKELPLLRKLQKELSQATAIRTPSMKLVVDKAPEGTRSPNLADATVMAYWPWHGPPAPGVSLFGPIVIRGS